MSDPESEPGFRQAARHFLAALSRGPQDPTTRDQMIDLADVIALALLADWLDVLQRYTDDASQLSRALGPLAGVLDQPGGNGKGRPSLLATTWASGERTLFEAVLTLGVAAVKFADWQAQRSRRPLDDTFFEETLGAIVRLADHTYRTAADAGLRDYLVQLTPLRFIQALLNQIDEQSRLLGMDLFESGEAPPARAPSPAEPASEARVEGRPVDAEYASADELLQALLAQQTPAEELAEIMLKALRPVISESLGRLYTQEGRGVIGVDLREPAAVRLIFIDAAAIQAQAGTNAVFQSLAQTVAEYDPATEFIAIVMLSSWVQVYRLERD